MIRIRNLLLGFFASLALFPAAHGQSSVFTYQGRLADAAGPANGRYDLRFALYDAVTGGTRTSSIVTNAAVLVAEGLFTTAIDLGEDFGNAARWLEIAVRPAGTEAFTTLSPRQEVTAVPWSLRARRAEMAEMAENAASLASGAVNNQSIAPDAITEAKIASGQVVKSVNGLKDNVTLAAGQNITLTPSGNTLTIAAPSGAAAGWALNGNAGTAATNFLGTTDGKPLVIKANNVGIGVTNPAAALDVDGTVKAKGLAAPFQLRSLGMAGPAGGVAHNVVVAGGYAYVANHYNFAIYDVSRLNSPEGVVFLKFLQGPVFDVEVSGQYAFLATGTGLVVLDVSSPTGPFQVFAANQEEGSGRGIALSGNYAYLANYQDGLRIYDVSNPIQPQGVGHVNDGGQAFAVRVAGNVAYLASANGGFRIYSVSDPTTPQLLAHVSEGLPRDVAVEGTIAATANTGGGVRIYDISDPTSPTLLKHIALKSPHITYSVAISRPYLYCANFDGGLMIFDISNPSEPVEVGRMNTPSGSAEGVTVRGPDVFLANGGGGLWTFFAGPLLESTASIAADRLYGDGSMLTNLRWSQIEGELPQPLLSDVWQFGGNSGKEGDQNLLGTKDNHPFELIANNKPALRLETSGSAVVDPDGLNAGLMAPGLKFGPTGGEGIASPRAAGEHQFSLGFYTDSQRRMSIDRTGNVQVEKDLLLRGAGAITNNGLGWYGTSKPFGTFQSDGPVLYGQKGGALATVENGRKPALTWDSSGVRSTGDLNVGGKLNVTGEANFAGPIKAGNLPSVTAHQFSKQTEISAWDQSNLAGRVATAPSDGFFLIIATAHFRWDQAGLSNWERSGVLFEITDDHPETGSVLVSGTSRIDHGSLTDLAPYEGTCTLSWVVPATGGKSRYFRLSCSTAEDTVATIFQRNLSVMFFPDGSLSTVEW